LPSARRRNRASGWHREQLSSAAPYGIRHRRKRTVVLGLLGWIDIDPVLVILVLHVQQQMRPRGAAKRRRTGFAFALRRMFGPCSLIFPPEVALRFAGGIEPSGMSKH
jgi:hypothetical protein